MLCDYPIVFVAMEKLAEGQPSFAITFPLNPDSLIESIKTVGIINPPVVRQKSNTDGFDIILGLRRITAFKALGHATIPCRVIPEKDLSDLDSIMLNLHDNLTMRILNPIEKGMALALLLRHVSRQDILADYMQLLGLPRHEPALNLHLSIANELSEDIKLGIAAERISMQAASEMLSMDPDTRETVYHLITYLRLNVNYQIQFIELLIDISKRDSITIPELTRNRDLSSLINDSDLSRPQKTRKVMEFLRDIRNPRLAQAEKVFRKALSSINLTDGDTIVAPSFYESPYRELRLRFRTRKELKEKLQKISDMEGIDDLIEPWKKR